jgi:hypothetical protein
MWLKHAVIKKMNPIHPAIQYASPSAEASFVVIYSPMNGRALDVIATNNLFWEEMEARTKLFQHVMIIDTVNDPVKYNYWKEVLNVHESGLSVLEARNTILEQMAENMGIK